MKISAVLIVKNEEKILSRCLDSLNGFEEIVVVDTGSEDKTIEIARRYDVKIGHFKWVDDFSKARNYAKQLATGDWILSIDADEVLKTPYNALSDILKQEKDKKVLGVHMVAEGTNQEHILGRLFKNDKDIKWVGAIHEVLNKPIEKDADVTVEYGYSPAHQLDPDIDFRILKKQVVDNPKLVRERYYLAREYYYKRDWQEAIDEIDRYLKVATWRPEINDAWLMRARCLSEQKKFEEACDCAWEALKYNANFKEALDFLSKHMDPVNANRWASFRDLADNSNVLFKRTE